MKQTAAPSSPKITPSRGPLVLRRCACGGSPGPGGECAECRKKRLEVQRKEAGSGPAVAPPIVHEVLRSSGRPLEPEVRSSVESRFGHDFSRVRVHTDARAAESARAVNALAYTVGENVVFGTGRYAPLTHDGRNLLGHELTHVIQQSGQGSRLPASLPVAGPEEPWEREADRMATSLDGLRTGGPAIRERPPAGLFRRRRGRKSMGGFEEGELQAYLQGLDRRGKIEDDNDSDDKARAIVEEWSWGTSPFELTTPRKILMIREMQSGFTGDEDENAILELLDGTDDADLLVIFGPGGIGAKNLRSDFHGAEEDRLLDFFRRRFEGGYDAVRRGRLEIRPRGLYVPGSAAVVAEARKRLEILYKYEAEWTEREARRARIALERKTSGTKRQAMDQGDPSSQARGEEEPGRISGINRRPLSIEIDEDQVVFRVRFHVRFEGRAGKPEFEELRDNLARGARMVWNQRLSGEPFRGRDFFVVPEVSPAPEKRDQNFWLITVRPTDRSDVSYPGCPQHTAPTEFPTSATDPTCDGGVMSIPPSHRTRPEILGHELLHLFGFFDRYALQVFRDTPTGPVTRIATTPMRETGGRPDPLGAENGTVLAEDLSLLFDRLGAFEQEENRGLAMLRQMERQGLSIEAVRGEIRRLEELVRNGGRQPSLIKPRQNFNDVMTRQAEDL